MIKPNLVDNEKLYTREEAVKALGISQASFSKYYEGTAVSNLATAFKVKKDNMQEYCDKKQGKHVKYRGALLNQMTRQILGQDYKPDLPESDNIVNPLLGTAKIPKDYHTDQQIYSLVKPDGDGYLGNLRPQNLIVKDDKVFYRYVLPLIKTWANQTLKPNIILLGMGDPTVDTTGYLSIFINSQVQYGKKYDVKTFSDIMNQQNNMLDTQDDLSNPELMPITIPNQDTVARNIALRSIWSMIDLLMRHNLKAKHLNRRTKVIVNDKFNLINKETVDTFAKILAISLGAKIDFVIVTNNVVPKELAGNATVIDNVDNFPIERDFRNSLGGVFGI